MSGVKFSSRPYHETYETDYLQIQSPDQLIAVFEKKEINKERAVYDLLAIMEKALNKSEQFMVSADLERAKSRGDYMSVKEALTAFKEHKDKYK